MHVDCGFMGEVVIYGIAPKTLGELNDIIEETKKDKNDAWERVLSFVYCNDIRTLMPADEERSPIEFAKEVIDDCRETIMLNEDRLTRLEILRDNWDKCHVKGKDEDGRETELAIPIPEELRDKCFYEGDYIPTVEQPTEKQMVEEMPKDVMDLIINSFLPKGLTADEAVAWISKESCHGRTLYPNEEKYIRSKVNGGQEGDN